MQSRPCLLIVLIFLSSVLHAESAPPARAQVYGGYSFLSNSMNGVPGSRQPLNGWDAGVAFPLWHSLRFKIDASSYTGTNLGAPQHPYFIMGGLQYDWHIRRETLFVDAVMGDSGINNNWGANKIPSETASVVVLAGGGLDTRLTRHVAFRVSGGFQYSRFALQTPGALNIPYRIPGLPTYFGRIASGMVWNF